MILQRVNFFHARFQPQRDFFSIRNGVLYLSFLLFSLFVGSMASWGYLDRKQAELGRQEEKANRTVVDSSSSNSVNVCHTALGDLFRLESQNDPFRIAPLLEQLANVHVPGVWLTGVEISQAGAEIWIQGAAFSRWSERLLLFVRMLAQQKVFVGYALNAFKLETADKSLSHLVSGHRPAQPVGRPSAAPREEGQHILKFRITVDSGKERLPSPEKSGKRS